MIEGSLYTLPCSLLRLIRKTLAFILAGDNFWYCLRFCRRYRAIKQIKRGFGAYRMGLRRLNYKIQCAHLGSESRVKTRTNRAELKVVGMG